MLNIVQVITSACLIVSEVVVMAGFIKMSIKIHSNDKKVRQCEKMIKECLNRITVLEEKIMENL